MLLDFVWHYPLMRQYLIRGKSSKVDNRRITEQVNSQYLIPVEFIDSMLFTCMFRLVALEVSF